MNFVPKFKKTEDKKQRDVVELWLGLTDGKLPCQEACYDETDVDIVCPCKKYRD
jgi:hypothetical protein